MAGKADLRILPTPQLSFTDVRVGDPDDPTLTVERIHAELELFSLLGGEVRVVHMAVQRPRLVVERGSPAQPEAAARQSAPTPANVSLGPTDIVEGSFLLRDASTGRQWEADGINAILEAGTLLGPARLDGGLRFQGRPLTLRASLGRFENGSAPLKLAFTPTDLPATVTADGVLSLSGEGGPAYAGTFSFAGARPEPEVQDRPLLADLDVLGSFDLKPEALDLTELEISYGPAAQPVGLDGWARIAIGSEPRFEGVIEARQIDLDRSLGGADGPVSVEAAAARLASAAAAVPVPPLPGTIRFAAQGLLAGGSVIQDVGLNLVATGQGWQVDRLSALLPGDTQLDFTSAAQPMQASAFSGHARLSARRPAAFASWWRGKTGTAAALPPFSVSGDLTFAPGRQEIADLSISLGEHSAQGRITVEGAAARVELRTERVQLEEARALFDLFAPKALAGGSVATIQAKLDAAVLRSGETEALGVSAEGTVARTGELKIEQLRIADLAGASLDISGDLRDLLGTPSGNVGARIAAGQIGGVTEFLAGLLPESPLIPYLREAGPALAPLDAELKLESGEGAGDLAFNVSGSFAGTRIALHGKGRGSLRDLGEMTGSMSGSLEAPDSANLLRQIGLEVLPIAGAPPAEMAFLAERRPDMPARLELTGRLAGVDMEFTGSADLASGARALEGRAVLASDDLDSALLLAGLAVPDLLGGRTARFSGPVRFGPEGARFTIEEADFRGEPVHGTILVEASPAVRLSGDLQLERLSVPGLARFMAGAELHPGDAGWSDAPIRAALPEGVAVDLDLTAGILESGFAQPIRSADLELRGGPGLLDIELRSGDLAGGRIAGRMGMRFGEAEASLDARAQITGADIGDLVWASGGRPVAAGRLDLDFDLTAQGRSMAGVVSTLTGTGSFGLRDTRLRSVNPGAFDVALRQAEAGVPLDPDRLASVFASHLDAGALELPEVSGSFTVSSGVLRVPTISVAAGPAKVLVNASVDLEARRIRSDWSILTTAPLANGKQGEPEVGLVFEGPIGAPERRLDVMPLVAFLNLREAERQVDALEREQARIAEEQRRADEARRQREEEERLRQEAEAEERRKAEEEAAAKAARDREAAEAARRAASRPAPPVVPPASGAPLDLLTPPPPPDDLLRQLAPAIEQEFPSAAPLGG